MPDSVKRLLAICEVVEQIALVLAVFLYGDSAIEDLFYSAPAWSQTCLFFCQMFLSLGLESGEDDSGHGLARMADWADDKIVLTLLEVAFLLLGPFLRLSVFLAYRCQDCCCCLALSSSEGMFPLPHTFLLLDSAQPLKPLPSAQVNFRPLVWGSGYSGVG